MYMSDDKSSQHLYITLYFLTKRYFSCRLRHEIAHYVLCCDNVITTCTLIVVLYMACLLRGKVGRQLEIAILFPPICINPLSILLG